MLLSFLRREGPTELLADGRISWAPFADGRVLEIVLTPEQWDEMVGTMWGDAGEACADVLRSAALAGGSERFLIYQDYQLEPWHDDHLPPPEPSSRPAGGRWVALDVDGNVVDRFADHPDEDGDA